MRLLRSHPGALDSSVRTAGLVVLVICFAIAGATPVATGTVFSDLLGLGYLGPAALGVAVVLIMGEFDLSVGALAAVGAVTTARVSEHGLVVSMVAAVVVCAVLGLVQASLMVLFRLNSIIATLVGSIAFVGLAQAPSNGNSVPLDDIGVGSVLSQQLWILSPVSIGVLFLFLLIGLGLAFHRWGRNVYAIGGGREEARAAGVPIARYRIAVFTLSAGLGGLSGSIGALNSGSGDPNAYSFLLIQAITAVMIGGIAISGGGGSVVSVLLGILTLEVIFTSMTTLAVPYYTSQIVQGLLLIFFITTEVVRDNAVFRRLTARSSS